MIRRWWREDLGKVERVILRALGIFFAAFVILALLPAVAAAAAVTAGCLGIFRAVRWAFRTDRAERLNVKLERQLDLRWGDRAP